MKRVCLILLFGVFCLDAWGQDDLYGSEKKKVPESSSLNPKSKPINDSLPAWVYCEIVGIQKFLNPDKVNVSIDYGQKRKFWADQRIRDENGQVITFNSMVDALNYMGAAGWEFLQAYTVTIGNSNVYHWLLRADLHNPVFLPETKKKD